MLPRFFLPGAADLGPHPSLPPKEARHAVEVMRLRAGDLVIVFDGQGREWRAAIVEAGKRGATVELLEVSHPAAEPRVRIALAQGVLKGDQMDTVVRDATMVGISAIAPIVTAHTVVNRRAASGTKAGDRWARVAVASAKQCRRAVVPPIAPAVPFDQWLASLETRGARIVLAEPSATLQAIPRHRLEAPPEEAVLAVGPEGGWTTTELEALARCGFSALTLGTLTLRAETAALVAVSALRAWWGEW